MLRTFVQSRWLLYLALAVFIIAKIPHLHFPFYWDESYVYAPAVQKMYEHGPSLLSGSIPLKCSTGHPLLFYAACATWMKVFGTSHFSIHCFAMAIAVLLVIAVYEVLRRVFDVKAALIGALLLLVNLRFFIASSFLLSDITLALLAFCALYYYYKERYLLTSIFLALLFFIKESGLVAAGLIFADIAVLAIGRKRPVRDLVARSVTVLVPMLLLAIFFVLQKRIYGWYFYPLHAGALNLGPTNTFVFLLRSMAVLFYRDNVYYFFIVLTGLSIVAGARMRNWRYLLPILGVVSVYPVLLFFSVKDVVFYVFLGFWIALLGLFFVKPIPSFSGSQLRFVRLLVAFCLLFIWFCGVNFYEERYVFPAQFIGSVVLPAVAFYYLLPRAPNGAFGVVIVLIVGAGIANIIYSYNDIVEYNSMYVHQDLVDYFETKNFYDKRIAAPFLEGVHLKDPNTGFLRSDKVFTNVHDHRDEHTELVVYDNVEMDEHYTDIKKDTAFYRVHRFQKGDYWVEAYMKR